MLSRSITQACARLNCMTIRPNKQLLLCNQTRGMRLYKERTVRSMYWRAQSYDVVKYEERKRDEFQDWNYRAEIYAFSRRLQENISEDALRKIFTHKSFIDKMKSKQAELNLPESNIQANTQLISRGSELLDICLKPYLRYTYKSMPEEGIVDVTNYLKSDEVLASVAKWIGCREIILCSEWPPSGETMANTVRALLSGIESDLGIERVQRFIVDLIITFLNDKDILDDVWIIPNPREMLNLILENNKLPAYEPRIMFQTSIKTLEPCHIIGLYVNQKLLGSSAGETLKIAEECAALESLRNLFDLTDNREPHVYGDASEKIDYKAHTKEHDNIKTWRFNLK